MKKTAFCFFVLLLSLSATLAQAQERDIVLTLPAETIQAAIKKILPLKIPNQGGTVEGDIIVESLDHLSIQDNVISVSGVLGGKNLFINTTVANNPLRLQLGQVRLPINCNLLTRFDSAKRNLFVSLRFAPAKTNQDADLSGLLDGLAGKEYQVDLDALKQLNLEVGERTIPVQMQTTNIVGKNNALTFYLRPTIGNQSVR